jgi:hypothetical protein
MNVNYFVLIAALLSFATGFFVAAIIWVIKWFITPREDRVTSNSVHLLHIFSKKELNREFAISSGPISANEESVINKELYQYYHGKN